MKRNLAIPAAEVNGFNYQPSYSSCAFETWRCYEPATFRKELSRGRELFPKMNAVRIWLSWNAWCRGMDRFLNQVGQTLDICEELGLRVVPVLFNRWHDSVMDCDGIYLDHFVPNSSWLLKYGLPGMDFVRDITRVFAADQRILAWDLCNEPFVYAAYGDAFPQREEYTRYEQNWLKQVAGVLEEGRVIQPIGVGTWGAECDPLVNDFVDVFLTHMYLHVPANQPCVLSPDRIASFEEKVRCAAEYAASVGKPIMTTETCWGSFDDAFRCELIKHSVGICKKHGIGVFAHALYESDFADIHRPEQGGLSPDIGHLEFIFRDGALRPGHEIINKFF